MKYSRNNINNYIMPKPCDKSLTFEECELAILRSAVDLAERRQGKQMVNTPDVKKMIEIVEIFLRKKQLICYGGVAIDALLPDQDKIYDKRVELSDYDFYSNNAMEDAKELADEFVRQGYTEVESKGGAHFGTYKVYCNYLAVADITYIPDELFKALKKEAVSVKGILYCPPNFLKMAMYLELSRPAGQIDRFEKVFKRLRLLNHHYPLTHVNCAKVDYQRQMTDPKNKGQETEIYDTVRKAFVNQGVVFFGGYAISLYSQYMPSKFRRKVKQYADFDVLAEDPEACCEIILERLEDIGITNAEIIKYEPVGEIIPEHYEIMVGKDDSIAMVYKPIACHSYNVINIEGEKVKIATIDTMLSFYLAFLYTNRDYYNEFSDRIVCMAKLLFDVQEKNRLAQKGLLRRFSINCYGKQETVEEMRAHKNEMFMKLKNKRGAKEYEAWFLNYKPQVKSEAKNATKSEKSEKSEKSDKSDKSEKSATKSKRRVKSDRTDSTRKKRKRRRNTI